MATKVSGSNSNELNPCTLLEYLAASTWDRLRLSQEFAVSQGETTITDNNLLEISRVNLPGIKVWKAKPLEEQQKGFDWEWWIGGSRWGWWRYSVQAKKLNLKKGIYDSLRHKVRDSFQIDLLRDFARHNKTIPLYCFYNHIPDRELAQEGWNCNLGFDAPQLGCTVAPLHEVEQQHYPGKGKTFGALHKGKNTLPWRCLVYCPKIAPTQIPLLKGAHPLAPRDYKPTLYQKLPEYLAVPSTVSKGQRNIDEREDEIIELPQEIYGSELGGYPKRIMVIDITEIE